MKLRLINFADESPVIIKAKLSVDFEVVSCTREQFQNDFAKIVDGCDFFMKASNLTILKDFSKHLCEEDVVGIFFADFYKDTIPVYHCSFPSHQKNYPFLIFRTSKALEAASKTGDLIGYISKNYIVRHIPELLCEAK